MNLLSPLFLLIFIPVNQIPPRLERVETVHKRHSALGIPVRARFNLCKYGIFYLFHKPQSGRHFNFSLGHVPGHDPVLCRKPDPAV
jgi:hypothetical protein